MPKYNNFNQMNNGFHANGPFPLDDREVLDSIEELYIDSEKRTREAAEAGESLYNRVYDGMTVKYKDGGKFHIAICENSAPYMPGSTTDINNSNVYDYWTVIF